MNREIITTSFFPFLLLVQKKGAKEKGHPERSCVAACGTLPRISDLALWSFRIAIPGSLRLIGSRPIDLKLMTIVAREPVRGKKRQCFLSRDLTAGLFIIILSSEVSWYSHC